ncbi:hypothetical protein JQC67_12885 [Aurantibacter crassamenti]|uniref:hypothetical protein n=1 Tax=Aurantibacter crassamenti TaxID=1837375 RepID=UPI0019398C10|nr:hypothetical protein [Aurantibacter crassamenti]MBM1107040.1 hypothetical protein [Aurantibacter crassamenti]
MNPKTAIKIMLYLLVAVFLFHVCILLKIVPYENTWGGRLKSDSEMYVFETISVLVNLFLMAILLIKGTFVKAFISMKLVNIILWLFFGLFVLNTIGNIFAKTNFEKFFTLVTVAFSVLIWIILRNEKPKANVTNN